MGCFALFFAACQRYWVCDDTAATREAGLPDKLSETGLFADTRAGTLAAGVSAYRPAFALWSDGAEKRRWVWLPPGSTIDTSDMDSWVFPVGTKLWKEFSLSGVRLETRLLTKVGAGEDEWSSTAYLWAEDQSDAVAVPYGAMDVQGTTHDVPAASECMACHGGRKSRVLGFSAIQLSPSAAPGELDLASLGRAGQLSASPAAAFTVPGNETERAALGYLHANCSHCHNQARPASTGARCFEPRNLLDFTLFVGQLTSPADTAAYQSAIGSVVKRGDPGGSKLISLVSHRGFFVQMPPIATESVDEEAVALLRRWVEGL